MGQRSDYGRGSHMPSDYSGNEGGRKRIVNDEKEQNSLGMDDTVYRYLCPLRIIGCIIGIGGDIVKQLRAETHAKIRISEPIPGCDERVITIYSTGEETNSYGDEHISPAMDALFRVHDKVVAEESPEDGAFEENLQVTARMLVPSDQIGCVIGRGGQIVQNIRNETQAQIRIMGSEHLPPCALSTDELIQISGEPTAVEKALSQVAFCLHDNPSRSQQFLLSSPSIYRSGISLNNPHVGGPVGLPSFMGIYGNYKNDGRDWSFIEFTLRLVCPTVNLGVVIGKGGTVIKQIRQESGAIIIVDSSGADGDDCIISVSSKETFEAPSRTIDAIMRLQQRCSEKIESDLGYPLITTRLLVPSLRIGCIIGKGGAIIKEMRSTSRANIRIFSDENIPKVASEDDAMIQITGDPGAAKNALLQVLLHLRANVFVTDGNSPAPKKYVNHDNTGYSSKTLPPIDTYGSYDDSQHKQPWSADSTNSSYGV